jgi:hypothetical protein
MPPDNDKYGLEMMLMPSYDAWHDMVDQDWLAVLSYVHHGELPQGGPEATSIHDGKGVLLGSTKMRLCIIGALMDGDDCEGV